MLINILRAGRNQMCRIPFLLILITVFSLISVYVMRSTKRKEVTLMEVENDNKPTLPFQWDDNSNTHSSRGTDILEETYATTISDAGVVRFEPFVYNPEVENFTRDIAHEYPCTKPVKVPTGFIEDLMCRPRPQFLPDVKNPCFRNEEGKFVCLPYFMLLGFDKCGTTDFHARLTLHPQVLKNDAYMGKEIYYWCWRRYGIFMLDHLETLSLDGYMDIFSQAATTIEKAQGSFSNQPVVGDGGPIDMWDFRGWYLDPQNRGLTEPGVITPHHIRHLLKDPKFIVMVREPVERLFSDYLFLMFGETAEEFDRDVPRAIELMTSCLKVNSTRQCFFSDDLYHKLPMRLHIGCYAVFLREWLSVFHRKHFFILRNEDYQRDMKGSLQEAFSFLGVETLTDSEMDNILVETKKFETSKKTTAGIMSEKSQKMLEDFYAPCNRELSNLLKDERFLFKDSQS